MSAKGVFCQNGTKVSSAFASAGKFCVRGTFSRCSVPWRGKNVLRGTEMPCCVPHDGANLCREERNLYFCVQLVICLWIWSFGAVRFLPTRNI